MIPIVLRRLTLKCDQRSVLSLDLVETPELYHSFYIILDQIFQTVKQLHLLEEAQCYLLYTFF